MKRMWWIGLGLCLASCGVESDERRDEVLTWEQYKQAATQEIEGKAIYVVEWDLAVSEAELRARYDAYREQHETAEGEIAQYSIVNALGWDDDIWRDERQMDLTYCVSDEFGANKQRVITEMGQATQSWEQVARVKFNYLAAHDANCNRFNTGVVIPVVPWNGNGACSFFPSGGGCVERTLVMNLATWPSPSWPGIQSVAVFRHELGHILGLRHEHMNNNVPGTTCLEAAPGRPVTGYDQNSVMHYPTCNGLLASNWNITSSDALGISKLYGSPVTNLALNRVATQSSTEFGGDALRGRDGNVDGNWAGNSVTHTTWQNQPWWRVDLGSLKTIGTIVIGNRTDCCSERLSNFDIDVSNDGVFWTIARSINGAVGARSTHTLNLQTRYVRIRLRGTGYLSLAEVQVFPPSNILFNKSVFGGNLWSQTFVVTTPPCSPGGFRTGEVSTVWNSQVGGNCVFAGFLSSNPNDCRANIIATTGGGGFGGQCRAWVRQVVP